MFLRNPFNRFVMNPLETTHICPRCKKSTVGSQNEIGEHSPLCDFCMNYLTKWSRFNKYWQERPADAKYRFRKTFGDLFEYDGLGGCYSVCGLRIEVEIAWHILMTGLVDNPGTTVTNGAEIIATNVYKDLMAIDGERAPHPDDIFWYAYHEHGKYPLDRVQYVWVEETRCFSDPQWVVAPNNPFGIE